jgi:hypothetical protein
VELRRIVPEALKPRRIAIGSAVAARPAIANNDGEGEAKSAA